uniref:Uncharacterized protein n=1 Tax=Avena sativa TaxID=4498 RepID=A0ACD5ZS48_AVESA
MGVVHGRCDLVLGSLIPCALFYFLQLYIKRNRLPSSPAPGSPTAASRATPSGTAAEAVSKIHSTLSRGIISPRGSRPLRCGALARAGDEDSLYYAGLRCCVADPYHPASNPSGIIQLGLAENHLLLDLVRRWMEEHAGPAPGGDDEDRDLTIRGLATYQPYDGILTLKMVEALSRCSGLPREKATLKSIDYQVRLRKSFMELLMDDTSGKTTLRCVAPITKGQLYSQITWVKQHQV